MAFNITGVPETVTAAGSLAGTENAIKGLNVEDVSINLGRAVRNIMAQLVGSCFALISVIGRKVWAADTNVFNALAGSTGSVYDAAVVLTPTPDQSGTSLEWGYGSLTTLPGGGSGATALAIKDLLDPKKPRYSVDGLISALARSIPDGQAPYIAVDQAAKTVTVGFVPTADQSDLDEAIDDLTPMPANRVLMTLEAIAPNTGDSSLPFEGGNV